MVCASAGDAVRGRATYKFVPAAACWGWDASGLLYERHNSGTIAVWVVERVVSDEVVTSTGDLNFEK